MLNAIQSKNSVEFVRSLGLDVYSDGLYLALKNYIFEDKAVTKTEKKTFDFDIDFRLLWADFKAVYNIDLLENKLNWWEFTALFERLNLLDGISATSKIVGIRQQKIPKRSKSNQDQIKYMQNMKRRYALEDEDQKSVKRFVDYLVRKAGGGNGIRRSN